MKRQVTAQLQPIIERQLSTIEELHASLALQRRLTEGADNLAAELRAQLAQATQEAADLRAQLSDTQRELAELRARQEADPRARRPSSSPYLGGIPIPRLPSSDRKKQHSSGSSQFGS